MRPKTPGRPVFSKWYGQLNVDIKECIHIDHATCNNLVILINLQTCWLHKRKQGPEISIQTEDRNHRCFAWYKENHTMIHTRKQCTLQQIKENQNTTITKKKTKVLTIKFHVCMTNNPSNNIITVLKTNTKQYQLNNFLVSHRWQ